jgi:hypothetical protein
MYNQDNLGIYDSNDYNTNNSANIQGLSFMDYRKKFTITGSEQHELLTKTSSSTVGSIIEAMNANESIHGYRSEAEKILSADEDAFNALFSQYTTAYNNYVSSKNIIMQNTSNGIVTCSRDSVDIELMEANLQALNEQLLALATKIVSQINNLKTTTHSDLRESILSKQDDLMNLIQNLKEQQGKLNNINKNYDVDSIDGAVETTKLNVDAFYLHFIVYFFIGVLLFVFIFNISINPEADTTKATFFIMTLLSVYIISRYVNK